MSTSTHRNTAVATSNRVWWIVAGMVCAGWGSLWAADGTEPSITVIDSRQEQILESPCVAYNSRDGRFLVAWVYHYGASDWDIDGRVLDAAGQPVGAAFGIAYKGSIKQSHPDVAYNPVTNEFLVAYELSPGNGNISACLVAGNGTPGPFVRIADDASLTETNPAVACDPVTGEYLVVYERTYALDSVDWSEVCIQRLLSDGTRLGEPYRLSTQGKDAREPAIACAGNQFLAVWQEVQADGTYRIFARIIQCGAPSKTTITVSDVNEDQRSPSVAYNPARAEYFVVYAAKATGASPWVVKGTPITTTGQTQGAWFYNVASSVNESCWNPDVVYNWADNQYTFVWAQQVSEDPSTTTAYQVELSRADSSGIPYPSTPITLCGPGMERPVVYEKPTPAIAGGTCGRSLAVWADETVVTRNTGEVITSVSLYSIVGAAGTWCSPCCDANCAD